MHARHGLVTLALLLSLNGCFYSHNTPYRPSYGALKGTAIGGATGMTLGAITGATAGGITGMTFGGAAIGAVIGGINDGEEGVLRQMHKSGIQVMQIGDKKTVLLQSDMIFDPNSYQLSGTAPPRLDLVAALLQKYKTPAHITVYTDNVGNDESTLKLSELQAESVQAYLWTRGVDLQRLSSSGKGSDFTIADNRTSKGSSYNRRVEIIF